MNIRPIYKDIIPSHPLATLFFIVGKHNYLHRAMVLESAKFLLSAQYDPLHWKNALSEIERLDLIPMNLSENGNPPTGNVPRTTLGKWLYCVVRDLKPEIVIETGVAHGISSWLILNALHKNNGGKLYSIDLPNNDTNKNYNFKENRIKTGWVVPDILRSRWSLQLGPSRELLPELLAKLGKVDIFFHDSEHSYANMMFEFTEVWPFLSHDGILASDDVQKNNAFADFFNKDDMKAILFRKGGSAVKQRQR